MTLKPDPEHISMLVCANTPDLTSQLINGPFVKLNELGNTLKCGVGTCG